MLLPIIIIHVLASERIYTSKPNLDAFTCQTNSIERAVYPPSDIVLEYVEIIDNMPSLETVISCELYGLSRLDGQLLERLKLHGPTLDAQISDIELAVRKLQGVSTETFRAAIQTILDRWDKDLGPRGTSWRKSEIRLGRKVTAKEALSVYRDTLEKLSILRHGLFVSDTKIPWPFNRIDKNNVAYIYRNRLASPGSMQSPPLVQFDEAAKTEKKRSSFRILVLTENGGA